MKTVRFMGAVLIAAASVVGFTACSDDEGGGGTGGTGLVDGKKLVKWQYNRDDGSGKLEGEYYLLEYDGQGRLANDKYFYANNGMETYEWRGVTSYIWKESTIHEEYTDVDSDGNPTSLAEMNDYTLENGLITHVGMRDGDSNDAREYHYEDDIRYDGNGRPVTIVTTGYEPNGEIDPWDCQTYSFIWDGDRLEGFTVEDHNGQVTTYTYSYSPGTPCKAYYPYHDISFHMDVLESSIIMAHPELVGLRLTTIPTELTYTDNDGTKTYKYDAQTDADGFLTRLTVSYSDLSYIYRYTWE